MAFSAHPRSRGEHPVTRCHIKTPLGSSPLARGTHGGGRREFRAARLIPARAGNTSAGLSRTLTPSAHPRSRGEHASTPLPCTVGFGSSPLARGTHQTLVIPAGGSRLIPARAGNTTATQSAFTPEAAHPRSRGEHFCSSLQPFSGFGSSPLARGTLIEELNFVLVERLIPARAGNTLQ